jgi:gas vesicle protein
MLHRSGSDPRETQNKKERWIMTNGRNGMMMPVGLSFLTGCLVGGAVGLLYAPQSGARTRRQLTNVVEDVKECAGEMVEDATGTVQRAVEHGCRLVNM